MSELELQAEKPGLIWHNNPVLVQLLGLSPLLAVSSSLVYAVGLGIATLFVCTASCLSTALLIRYIPHKWRLLWFMLIVASFVTLAETITQLYFYPLFLRLGIYIPLICCNVFILIRMELAASRSGWVVAALDGLRTGLGFLTALLLVAALRELLISGTLLSNWQLLLPTSSELSIITEAQSETNYFLFANTQAGALITLGLLAALTNKIRGWHALEQTDDQQEVIPAKRARVTGRLIRSDSKD